MKKYSMLLTGICVMVLAGLYLPMSGCKKLSLDYLGDNPPENAPKVAADLVYGYRLINVGDPFPATRLKSPDNSQDRSYLGLGPDAADFSIRDIEADLVLVEMLNTYCVPCLEQVSFYNDLFEAIEADESMRGRIKMLAVGVGNNEEEIRRFREEYNIPFPVVADPRMDLHEAVGEPRAPFSILVRLEKQPEAAMVALTYLETNGKYENLHQDMAALATMELAVFREQGARTEAVSGTIEPPISSSEIEKQIKTAMAGAGSGDDDISAFRKIAGTDRHVYTGVRNSGEEAQRLFAEVVSSPTICAVCQDVHFFYIFNEKGAIVDFVPLQLTKWGNKQWAEEDVRLMRERLVGRFVFTPFYFNPQLDAVSSATITSAIIFDELSRGRALFDLLKQKGLIS